MTTKPNNQETTESVEDIEKPIRLYVENPNIQNLLINRVTQAINQAKEEERREDRFRVHNICRQLKKYSNRDNAKCKGVHFAADMMIKKIDEALTPKELVDKE